jgi:formamidopyrimidine-DNA glycosylase
MPELPEVENYRKYLEGTSLGKTIGELWIDDARLTKPGKKIFSNRLKKNRFTSVSRIGKYLFVNLADGGCMVMHFGLTGNLSFFNNRVDQPKYTRVLFQFTDGSYLAYICKRKFGWLSYEKNLEQYLANSRLGIDATQLTFKDFFEKIGGRNAPVKSLLLDQSIAAGVGNWIADEILYQSKIHPETKTKSLERKEIRTLFNKLKRIIEISLKTEANYDKFPKHFLIHNREPGGKCYYTGKPLIRIVVGGRGSFISPTIQIKK